MTELSESRLPYVIDHNKRFMPFAAGIGTGQDYDFPHLYEGSLVSPSGYLPGVGRFRIEVIEQIERNTKNEPVLIIPSVAYPTIRLIPSLTEIPSLYAHIHNSMSESLDQFAESEQVELKDGSTILVFKDWAFSHILHNRPAPLPKYYTRAELYSLELSIGIQED